jgi:hypothetical protein
MFNKEMIMEILDCLPDMYPKTLENRFPHVLSKIIELWNSPHCEAYFTDLLLPNGRGGGRLNRDGFPDDAWQEIFQLNELCWMRRSNVDENHC